MKIKLTDLTLRGGFPGIEYHCLQMEKTLHFLLSDGQSSGEGGQKEMKTVSLPQRIDGKVETMRSFGSLQKHVFSIICLAALVGSASQGRPGSAVFNVLDYGAKGDGKTCYSGAIYLKPNVDFHLEKGAVLLGSSNEEDYGPCADALVNAVDAPNVSVTGGGEINGNASSFMKELRPGGDICVPKWLNPVDSLDIPISKYVVFSDVLVKDGTISNKWQSLRTLDEDGLLGQRVDLWRNHRLWFIAESGYLIDGFEKRPGTHAWQGEHLGKWLHAATLAYQVTGDEKLKKELDRMVKRLIATQLPDGYLGTYPEQARFMNVPENEDPKLVTDDIETKKTRSRKYRGGWDTWIFRYNLYGLLTYEKYFPNEQVVEACRKMADLLIKTYGTDRSDLTKYGTRKGISATTLLESIVMLYERTSDKKYLDFAEEIVRMSENNPGLRLMGTMLNNGSVVHPGEGKGYQLMANLLGYLRLYRCTGSENYLKAVTCAWNDIQENHILVTGGPWSRKMPYNGNSECFARTDAFDPEQVRVEGCCDATWIQLNIHLFELTGQAKYMNEAEVTLLNDLYGHQHRGGKEWCYFTKPNEPKMAYTERFHCCGSSMPRGMEMYSDHLAGTIGKNLSINTLFPATIQVANQFGGGRIKIEGKFPLESSAEIHIETLKKKKFTLEFRLPANTSLIHVEVNGKKTKAKKNARGFFELTRKWRNGDVIAVDMDFDLKASVQVGEENEKWVAFNYGPHALAQKISAIPDEEPFSGMSEREVSRMLRMLSKSSDSDIAFSIKGADVTLIPYYMACTEQSGPRTYFRL